MERYIEHYHLYLDELSTSSNCNSAMLFKDGERQHDVDIDAELPKPLLKQSWDKVWCRILEPVEDREKVLHVFGSEFGQRFFSALAATQKGFRCSADETSAPFPLLGVTLSDRIRRLAALCEKHAFNIVVPFTVNIDSPRHAERFASVFDELFSWQKLFPVHFCADEIKADLSIAIATSREDLNALSEDVVFVVNEDGRTDNVLYPRDVGCYFWMFNSLESLKDVVQSYVASVLWAPAFVRLYREFGIAKFHELSSEEVMEWLTLGHQFPFAYAIVPDVAVVEQPIGIELGYVGLSGDDSPVLSIEKDVETRVAECNSEGRNVFTPSDIGLHCVRWLESEHSQGILISTSGHESSDDSFPIDVRNHGLATNMEVCQVDGPAKSCFEIPKDGNLSLEVKSWNRYDQSITPTDAQDWQWELSGDGARIERNGSRLDFYPARAGNWKLKVFWPDPTADMPSSEAGAVVLWKPVRNLCATVDIAVFNRAEAMCVKLEPLPQKGHPPFKVEYTPNKVYAECFPGDGFALSAWLEGEEPLWNKWVQVEGLKGIAPWSDKDKVFKRGFGKPGKKEFTVISADEEERALLKIVELEYKVNHSDTARGWMIACMILSVLSATCSYGLNWFNFILYVSPIGVAGIHFKFKLPMYRRFMGVMLAIAAFLFLRAICQEIF